MMRRLIVLLALAGWSFVEAQTDYVITDFPIAAVSPTTRAKTSEGTDTTVATEVRIAWSGIARPGVDVPDSGDVYYSRVPLGTSIVNRTKVLAMVSDYNARVFGSPPQRMLRFRPLDQATMGAGVFYFVVARRVTFGSVVDTFCSNELQMIVESTTPTELTAPSGSTTDLTPTFKWNANPGVPYYHLILSDEEIKVDSSSGQLNVAGLSIVWQAITPNTQIVYGAPDPSGTITATPPPMSPGNTYSAVVLNNYGNHPAYTSARFGLPKIFTIAGDTLMAPRNLSPIGDSLDADSIRFSWTNLDPTANTYRVYIYVASKLDKIDAQMVVWDGEVTAGTFTGATAFINVNARSVLTKNHYTWKVMAIDDRGAGRAGDTTSFDYTSSTGTLKLYTKELVTVGDTSLPRAVSAVEIQVEVLSGSLEKPLLFYTDNNGQLSRDRPEGTYRITAVKKGFEDLSMTLEVAEGKTTIDTLILRRPDATVFGTIVDQSGSGIDLATVIGVSERNDTVRAETDRYGSFVMNCYGADWNIWAMKTGYVTGRSRAIAAAFGESVKFGTDTLVRVPYTLSGVVSNADGGLIIGASVKLYRDNTLVDQVPSTSQTGAFSFSVSSGQYTLEATKTGFTSASLQVTLSSSKQIALSMSKGAAVVKGYVIGSSWINSKWAYAAITRANVFFAQKRESGLRADTSSVTTDATYGGFQVSLAGADSFWVWSAATGFADDKNRSVIRTSPGVTQQFTDSLVALAMIKGLAVTSMQRLPVDKASVSLVDTVTGKVAGSGASRPDGRFEVRNLADGIYRLQVGRDGLVTDSMSPGSIIRVLDGKPVPDSVWVSLKAGTKSIRWSINGGASTIIGEVKIQSPMRKTLSTTDTLKSAGAGDYVITVDAENPSYLDLAYHQFTVLDSVTEYLDAVQLPATHTRLDSISLVNDSLVSLSITSATRLDSARVFYRAATAAHYQSSAIVVDTTQYTFRIKPPCDGADMVYYFTANKDSNVYGYESETHRTFVKPDQRLSKIEILPGSGDTLTLVKGMQATFRLKGYYSSAYLPKENIDSTAVSWSIPNKSAYDVVRKRGLSLTITPLTGSEIVKVVATVSGRLVRSGADSTDTVFFRVIDSEIDSLWITRVDPANPNPISTAQGDKAEFLAHAFTADSTAVTLTPQWSIEPSGAGTIAFDGTFTPASRFAGWVGIVAMAQGERPEMDVRGLYNVNIRKPDQSGLLVRHVVTRKSTPDTTGNRKGCTIVLPPNVVESGQTGLIDIANVTLDNIIARGLDSLRVLGKAYDINEANGVVWQLGGDSLRISLEVPAGFGTKALSGSGGIVMGQWNADSLLWRVVPRSVVSVVDSDTVVTAAVCHFSRYAVLSLSKKLGGTLKVSPNPFTPYYYAPDGDRSHRGTRISYEISSEFAQVSKVTLRVYNILGDLVWAVVDLGTAVTPGQTYEIWWNGKTSDGEIGMDAWKAQGAEAGDRLCRNGRYIVVLSIRDQNNKERRYLKHIVLMK